MNQQIERSGVIILCTLFLFSIGCATRETIKTDKVVVGKVLVESTPSSRIKVGGRLLGTSPIEVPIECQVRTVRILGWPSKHEDPITNLLTLPFCILEGVFYNLGAKDVVGFLNRGTEREYLHKAVVFEASLPGYLSEKLTINSASLPSRWSPKLIPTEAHGVYTRCLAKARRLYRERDYVGAGLELERAVSAIPEMEEARSLLEEAKRRGAEQHSGRNATRGGATRIGQNDSISDSVDWRRGDRTDWHHLSVSGFGLLEISVESDSPKDHSEVRVNPADGMSRLAKVDKGNVRSWIIPHNTPLSVEVQVTNRNWGRPVRYSVKTSHVNGRDYGVFVGISEYLDPNIPSPPFCDKDATEMAGHLARFGFAPNRIRLLTNDQGTKAAIYRSVSDLCQLAGPADRFTFFFSGHGGGGARRRGSYLEFLLPYDAVRRDARNKTWSDSCISPEFFVELFRDLRCQTIVLIFDSCFSASGAEAIAARVGKGTALGDLTYRGESDDSFLRGVSVVAKHKTVLDSGTALQKKVLVLCASQADQPAWGDKKLGHGIFTYGLLKALREVPQGDMVSWDEICGAAGKLLKNERQQPRTMGSFLSEKIGLFRQP